ncbi:MAG: alpha/beta hydrolase [Thermodesulfobacteriota bacterium]
MPRSTGKRDHEWLDYYEKFRYFSARAVRDGCHPRLMEHGAPAAKSIVLVHGLTDSPYFLTAIGDYFFNLGYNVYLPLLHGHGLKEPRGMEGVSLEEWKANVNFAVDYAAAKRAGVSIGGFSTGGTLGFYASVKNRKINGSLYLFSAALDLAGGIGGLLGELKERLLRTFLADVLDNNQPLIGANPYRYSRMDLDGARELAMLIRETDELLKQFTKKEPFAKPVFAAHSESDTTANITGIEDLQQVSLPDRFTFFRIPAALGVPHASLVLREPIYAGNASAGDAPLEKANPQFHEMMAAMAAMG